MKKFVCIIVAVLVLSGCSYSEKAESDASTSKEVEDSISVSEMSETVIDRSAYSTKEVFEYLDSCGFSYKHETSEYIYTTTYDMLCRNDEKSRVLIQRIDNPLIGVIYAYSDSTVSVGATADILDYEKNKSNEEKLQYSAYLYWIGSCGLTQEQIIEVLDYCAEIEGS